MHTKFAIGILATIAITTQAKMTITTDNNYRHFYTDSLPNYTITSFPNRCCPNTPSKQNIHVKIPLNPIYREETVPLEIPKKYGIMIDSVIIEPNADEYWSETESTPCNEHDGHTKNQWPYAPLSELVNLGMDDSNAHVQPGGLYHYHGMPTNLYKTLNLYEIPLIGYAADGFPIYAHIGYTDPMDKTSTKITLKSSFALKHGTRPIIEGGPSGDYDGRFESDYEFIEGHGDLDACNGRTGVTPQYPNGTYYYVITTEYPWIGRCFHGIPDTSFDIKGEGPRGNRRGRGMRPRNTGIGPQNMKRNMPNQDKQFGF